MVTVFLRLHLSLFLLGRFENSFKRLRVQSCRLMDAKTAVRGTHRDVCKKGFFGSKVGYMRSVDLYDLYDKIAKI